MSTRDIGDVDAARAREHLRGWEGAWSTRSAFDEFVDVVVRHRGGGLKKLGLSACGGAIDVGRNYCRYVFSLVLE